MGETVFFRYAKLAVIGAALGGCAQSVWVKPGATEADFEVEKGRCIATAYSQVPAAPAVATFGTGYVSPTYTSCSGFGYSVNCTTSGGQYSPPISVPYDANVGARTEVFRGCMYANGWSLEEKGKSAARPVSAPALGTTGLTFRQAHDVCKEELQQDGTSASPDAWQSCMQKHGWRLD